MNHWEFLAITCSLFKAREKSRVQGAISFSFASHVSFSHQRWTNRLTICAAYVNSGLTLFDLFVWMDKSSSKDRLQEVDKQREKFRQFVRPKTYSSLFHTTCPSRRFVRLKCENRNCLKTSGEIFKLMRHRVNRYKLHWVNNFSTWNWQF